MSTDGAVRAVNEAFYRAEPADYVLTRLALLMGYGADPELALTQMRNGIDVRGIKLRYDVAEVVDEAIERHLRTDLLVLSAHAVETFLRQFLAHCGVPQSPPVRLAELGLHSEEFAQKLRMLTDDTFIDDLRRETGQVICGIPSGSSAADIERRNGCAEVVRDIAVYWQEHKDLYNALKHGLAATAGSAELRIGVGDLAPPQQLAGSGDSFQYLTRSKAPDGYAFHSKIIWVDLDRAVAVTYFAAIMIQNMWTLGRLRYANGPQPATLNVPIEPYRPSTRAHPIRTATIGPIAIVPAAKKGTRRPPRPNHESSEG